MSEDSARGVGDESARSMSDSDKRKRRFGEAVVWNIASIAVLGVSGILLNLLILRSYDEATLGVFNQALAAYIFFSQLAVGGINVSVLRAIAEEKDDARRVADIVAGGYALTIGLAFAAAVLLWLMRAPIAGWLDSPDTAIGIAACAPGIFFFALNKVGLAVVNGRQRMRAFAVYTSLRYLLILVALLGFQLYDTERTHGAWLAFVFTFSETVLFLVLAPEVLAVLRARWSAAWKHWATTHFSYGVKSCASGVLLELNARVDVLMIGHFMADRFVGIYTIAAMVAEGVYQLLVVLQNMYNPIVAREIAARRIEELLATIKKTRRLVYAGMVVVGAIAVLVYPYVVPFLSDKPGVLESSVPFAWLALGIVLASGYTPFAQTLLMANQPAWHTLYMTVTVLVNVVGNALLIPHFGLAGAAIATSTAMFTSVFVLKALVRRRVGLRL